MTSWSKLEEQSAQVLVKLALEEDLGQQGDITTDILIGAEWRGTACIIARRAGVICGRRLAEIVLGRLDPGAEIHWDCEDGSKVSAGTKIGQVRAQVRALLSAERTALNFLQKLSGVATLTQQYVQAIDGLPCVILDTRKTTPGWRVLEKYAVRCGGGQNHRRGLYDGILIKDNHLAALRERGQDLAYALRQIRLRLTSCFPIEIEAENLEQVAQALQEGADIILLDNMPLDMLRQAVELRNRLAPRVLLEASGGITLENVRAVAETGVDRISIGALTHSAPALDLALEFLGCREH
ncbi:MAG: carboxylating nicotinate-nucleotide diphosphorylase [Gemmatales bacterium]|nr:carboxylating nicotinate-nucleotide diphosphorylase [Gemmatales bacterium]MDW8223567.1 carboxylating nicotinate-nucleotide diphosphorylase [Gemmatales bacterium]